MKRMLSLELKWLTLLIALVPLLYSAIKSKRIMQVLVKLSYQCIYLFIYSNFLMYFFVCRFVKIDNESHALLSLVSVRHNIPYLLRSVGVSLSHDSHVIIV